MAQQDWKPTGWLGIVLAGAVWTALEEDQLEDSVEQLAVQIQRTVGEQLRDEELDDDDDGDAGLTATSIGEAKEELSRLRDTLSATAVVANAAPLGSSQLALIPAGVPKLPSGFVTTEPIRKLTHLVLATGPAELAKPTVGFFGTGGIGKTITGAAVVRDEAVRKHFDAIIWLPLGQNPVISKMQNLAMIQACGTELSIESSGEEKKESLQQAMAGRRILLCLDDLWEMDHEPELNWVDVSAGSKVLISTRIERLLAGAHKVEVGLPSLPDSGRILLSTAGVLQGGAREPAGVAEIVSLCGRLPFALGIAGRLAASLGLAGDDDWTPMIPVLRDDLRESHSGGTEEGMIRASLRGLRGSAKEQTNVKALLNLFAFVPEDTHCPLDLLLLMFRSVVIGSTASIMHIRKWLRILLTRSLVLGSIDRPSVHDLTLDFAISSHTTGELQQGHQRILEAFRQSRTVSAAGICAYDYTKRVSCDITRYVCNDADHHCKAAFPVATTEAALEYLNDVPQDPLATAFGRAMGVDALSEAAQQAESAGANWSAACRWAMHGNLMLHKHGRGEALPSWRKALAMIARTTVGCTVDEKDQLEIMTTKDIIMAHDVDGETTIVLLHCPDTAIS